MISEEKVKIIKEILNLINYDVINFTDNDISIINNNDKNSLAYLLTNNCTLELNSLTNNYLNGKISIHDDKVFIIIYRRTGNKGLEFDIPDLTTKYREENDNKVLRVEYITDKNNYDILIDNEFFLVDKSGYDNNGEFFRKTINYYDEFNDKELFEESTEILNKFVPYTYSYLNNMYNKENKLLIKK